VDAQLDEGHGRERVRRVRAHDVPGCPRARRANLPLLYPGPA
jgi:hypothetical protein